MIYFKKILRYALPYKRYAFLNIFFNILYAVFSALSFVVLMPLFEVIFKTDEKIVYEKPIFEGFTSGMEYLNNYFTPTVELIFNKIDIYSKKDIESMNNLISIYEKIGYK
mgnify:CR=1 FL=1